MDMVVKHLLEHGSGRLSYRRTIPAEFRPFVGYREFQVPLGDHDGAGFGAKYDAAKQACEAVLTKARRQLAGAYGDLDAPTIAYLAEVFHIQALANDDAARWSPEDRDPYLTNANSLRTAGVAAVEGWKGREASRWADKARQRLEDNLPLYRSLRANGDMDGIVAIWMTDALHLIEAQGMMVRPDAIEPFRQLCRALNDAAIRASDARLARLDGAEVPTPPEPQGDLKKAPRTVKASVPLLATFDA